MNRFQSRPAWWAQARAQQLVQSDWPAQDREEPSPLVIAMVMLGVLVCTLPIAAFLLLVWSELMEGVGGTVFAVLMLAVAGALLRRAEQAFVSCAGLVLWGLGLGLLLFKLGLEDFETRQSMLLLFSCAAVLQLLGGWLASVRWIQAVMGVGWAVAVYGMCFTLQRWSVWMAPVLLGCQLIALLWCLWLRGEVQRLEKSAMTPPPWWTQLRWAVFADAAIVGLLFIMVLMDYGMSASSLLGSIWWSHEVLQSWRWLLWLARGLDVLAVLLATAWLLRVWRQRQLLDAELQYVLVLVGSLLAVCAWFSPGLGAVSLIAAGALMAGRWRIAVLCALAALSFLGHFYYLLSWPLAIKGLGLAALGALLLIGLLWPRRGVRHEPAALASETPQPRWIWVLLGAVLIFGVVNWDVRGKEQVIAQGQRILVPLVPVDPRSLMQGDYMALRFDLPPDVLTGLEKIQGPLAHVLAGVDAQGVAFIKALADDSKAVGEGEVLLPLKRLKGRWVLVTDAYFFPEGQGEHFAQGRFGDFRVLPDGRALLVGLADGAGQEIKPLPGGSIWDLRPAAERLNSDAMGEEDRSLESSQDMDGESAPEAPEVVVEEASEPPPAIKPAERRE